MGTSRRLNLLESYGQAKIMAGKHYFLIHDLEDPKFPDTLPVSDRDFHARALVQSERDYGRSECVFMNVF